MLRALPLLDEMSQLDAAHPGHLHIEHNRGKLVVQEREQCFLRPGGPHQAVFRRLEHLLKHFEIPRLVVDQEDVGGRRVHIDTGWGVRETSRSGGGNARGDWGIKVRFLFRRKGSRIFVIFHCVIARPT